MSLGRTSKEHFSLTSYTARASGPRYRPSQGTYTYANGYVYEGEWERDEKNGKGRQAFAGVGVAAEGGGEEPAKVAAVEGVDWYEGQWEDGNHHGQGDRSRPSRNGSWKVMIEPVCAFPPRC